jgi:hypothetical protein
MMWDFMVVTWRGSAGGKAAIAIAAATAVLAVAGLVWALVF